MKYIVRKKLPGAKIGTLLRTTANERQLCVDTGFVVIPDGLIPVALDQGFIEPYEEKPKRWRANPGENFWTIEVSNNLRVAMWEDDPNNHNPGRDVLYSIGNYFKSKETAEAVAEALKLFFEWLHTPKQSDQLEKPEILAAFQKAQREARRKVLSDNEVSDE